jgi:hypothetical protein
MAVKGDLETGDWVLTEPMGINPGQRVHPDRSTGASKAAGPAMGSSPVMKM